MPKKEPACQGGNKLGLDSSLANIDAQRIRAEEYRRAKAELVALERAPDFLAEATAYIDRWPGYPPDYFYDSDRKRWELSRRAFDDGQGWPCRLLSSVNELGHYTLHAEHLGFPESAAAPQLLFDQANIRLWKRAIKRHFKGPLRWKLELGENGRIHVHILADLWAGLPELPRGGEIVKSCESYFEKLVGYLLKPPAPYIAEALALWLEARRWGHLPQLSGTMNLPNKAAWENPSVTTCLFLFPPTSNPNKPPEVLGAEEPSERPCEVVAANCIPESRGGSQGRAEATSAGVAAPQGEAFRSSLLPDVDEAPVVAALRCHHEMTRVEWRSQESSGG